MFEHIRRMSFVAIPAALLLASVGVGGVAAGTPPAVATGTFTVDTDSAWQTGAAGPNTFWSEVATGTYYGALTGSFTDTDSWVAFPDGSFEDQGTETCTGCTIGGRTGDFESVWVSRISSSGNVVGHLTFTGGSGGLAGLHGGGTFENLPTALVYSYQYSFEP